MKEQKIVTLESIMVERSNYSFQELRETFFSFEGEIHLIRNLDNDIVGFIEFSYTAFNNDLDIKLIEILDSFKNQGYAKATISLLKKQYPKCNIFGVAISDEAKYIWSCLGASFDSCEEAECPYNSYEECPDKCDEPASYTFSILDK